MDKQLTFYAPIDKADKKLHMVYGYASTEAVDSQGEIVKKDALSAALADYMKYANIREMHQPSAVGKTKQATLDKKGLYIAAKIVDPLAWEKIEEGVYNGFSIGGRVDTMVDNEITALKLAEISLVDRPANPEAMFDVWKADATEKRTFSDKERKTLASSGAAMPDGSYPIVTVQDLKNAIRSWGRGGAKADVKAHIKSRASTLGRTDLIPDNWKADMPEMTKDVYGAANLINLACNLNHFIECEKAEGEGTDELETALETIKTAITTELNEGEDYPQLMQDAFAYAEKTMSLKKVDGDEESVTEEPKGPADNAIVIENETEEVKEEVAEPTDTELETVEEKVAEDAVEEKETEPEEENENANKDLPDEEEAEKVEQTDEELLLEKTTKTLSEFKMPTDEDITAMLKYASIDATPRAISVMKYELAGKIVENIEKSRLEQFEKDAVKNKMEKTKDKIDKTVAFVGNKEILTLVEQLEAQMKKNTDAESAAYDHEDIATLPASKESPQSAAEMVSAAMQALQAAIDKLNQESTRTNLSPDEEQKLRDGVVAGSERTSKDRVLDQNKVNEREVGQPVTTFHTAQGTEDAVPPSRQMSETTEDLSKLDTEITLLKAEIEKLKSMPMPVKAKASYTVIEKFDNGNAPKSEDLLARIESTSQELKARPYDVELQKKANDLSAEWMRHSRGDNASNN